jgi:hypothetical protein
MAWSFFCHQFSLYLRRRVLSLISAGDPTISDDFSTCFLAQSLQTGFNRLHHIFALVAAGIGYA